MKDYKNIYYSSVDDLCLEGSISYKFSVDYTSEIHHSYSLFWQNFSQDEFIVILLIDQIF